MPPAKREPLPWTRFSYDDFFRDRAVVSMGDSLVGPYLRLMHAAWKACLEGWPDGHLPNDEAYLANASGLGERWGEHREAIAKAFKVTPEWWVQKRIVEEYAASRRISKVRSASGSLGAVASNGKRSANAAAIAPANADKTLDNTRGRDVKIEDGATAPLDPLQTVLSIASGKSIQEPGGKKFLVDQKHVWEAAQSLPDGKRREAMKLVGWLSKQGVGEFDATMAFARFVRDHQSIEFPFRYFNPKGEHWRLMAMDWNMKFEIDHKRREEALTKAWLEGRS